MPKKGKKAAGTPDDDKSKTPEKTPEKSSTSSTASDFGLNAALHAKVKDISTKTMAEFVDVYTAPPRGTNTGGRLPAFDKHICEQKLLHGDAYTCSANWWSQDLLSSVTPRTPITQIQISSLKDFMFTKSDKTGFLYDLPDRLPAVCIRVPSAKFDIAANLGKLQRCSPDEEVFAVALAWGDVMEQDAISDAELAAWKNLFTDAEYELKVLKTGLDGWYHNQRIRQQINQWSASLTRTPLPMIAEVVNFKLDLEQKDGTTLSAATVAKNYQENVVQSSAAEAFTDSFVDNALTVHKRMLSDSEIRDVVWSMECKWGHSAPLNSVYKLQALLVRARQKPLILWCCRAIDDASERGALKKDEMSVRMISGAGGRNTSIIDVLSTKFDVKVYLLVTFMDQRSFLSETKASLRLTYESHASYAKFVDPIDGSTADLSFQRVWEASARKLSELIENTSQISFTDTAQMLGNSMTLPVYSSTCFSH